MAIASPDSAVNQSAPASLTEDTSASKDEIAEPEQQASQHTTQPIPEQRKQKKPPPGFERPAADHKPTLKPIPNAWFKSKALQPTAAAFDPKAAPTDPTAAASTPQPGPSLPAKPMPSGRQQRYRPDEAEQAEAEQNGDQEAKRSRTGQSPHHPNSHTPELPSQEEAEQVSSCKAMHSLSVLILYKARYPRYSNWTVSACTHSSALVLHPLKPKWTLISSAALP